MFKVSNEASNTFLRKRRNTTNERQNVEGDQRAKHHGTPRNKKKKKKNLPR